MTLTSWPNDITTTHIQELWRDDSRFGGALGPISILASDGDATRRVVLHQRANVPLPTGDGSLEGCGLLEKHTDVFDAMQCYDFKHNLKRFRTRNGTKIGQQISRSGLTLSDDTMTQLFRIHDKDAKASYRDLFHPEDK